jgi:putative sigma-54 modulation protein
MKLSVTFRHMDPSEALKQHVEAKLERLEKYFAGPSRGQAVLSKESYRHKIDVTVTLANGTAISGKETAEDMYSAIDLVVDKLDRQIRRYKDKITSRRATLGSEQGERASEGLDEERPKMADR